MRYINSVLKWFNNHYIIFLVLLVIISYGQILGLYVWEDDHALFFKLAHIQEGAGYFGPGPFGSGIYRYAAVPFIPIYYFFGHFVPAYFGLILILYLITTIVIYKVFSTVINETAGKVASFMYGAGYIVSDGVWRMANSATTSISIIFANLFLLSYWKFYKNKKITWYILAILFFFLGSEITISRMHYFIIIPIVFELIFLAFKKPYLKSSLFSLIRIMPFYLIFKTRVIGEFGGDSRTNSMSDFVGALFKGQFNTYFGFLSSLTNLLVPDWLVKFLVEFNEKLIGNPRIENIILASILVTIPSTIIYLLYKNRKITKPLAFLAVGLNILWVLLAHYIFKTPVFIPTKSEYLVVTLGGIILFLVILAVFTFGKKKKTFLFLTLWLLANTLAYCAYTPDIVYSTTHRYLAHSFAALVGIIALIFISLPKTKVGIFIKSLIILLGAGNLITSLNYQYTQVQERGIPIRAYFATIDSSAGRVKKGDVFYIDIGASRQRNYRDAMATAMMPETTALAWRYGIDRYDIKLTNNFEELIDITSQEKVIPEKIHAFSYTKNGLVDISEDIRNFIKNKPLKPLDIDLKLSSKVILTLQNNQSLWRQPEMILDLPENIKGTLPQEVTLKIIANPLINPETTFPLVSEDFPPTAHLVNFLSNPKNISDAFGFINAKKSLIRDLKFSASSDWQGNLAQNLSDLDIGTYWQSNRVFWGNKDTFIQAELPIVTDIAGIAWLPGITRNIPSQYMIQESLDGKEWKNIKEVNLNAIPEPDNPQKVSFNPVKTKFIRMVFQKTFNSDSPIVAELWLIPIEYKNLDITLAEEFLKNPFSYIKDELALNSLLSNVNFMGNMQLSWENDGQDGWQTNDKAVSEILYDGVERVYEFNIPPGGTKISRLKLSNINIPGEIKILKEYLLLY